MERPEPGNYAPTGTEPAKPAASERARQRWHIDRIGTEPLTDTQHDHAVILLADLITHGPTVTTPTTANGMPHETPRPK